MNSVLGFSSDVRRMATRPRLLNVSSHEQFSIVIEREMKVKREFVQLLANVSQRPNERKLFETLARERTRVDDGRRRLSVQEFQAHSASLHLGV